MAESRNATSHERLMMRLLDAARRLQGVYVWAVGLPKGSPARGPGNDLADCLDEIRGLPAKTVSAIGRTCQDGIACKKPGECEARGKCAVFGNLLSSVSAPSANVPARTFTICEDHKDADWNQPAMEGVDCILCRLFYLEAQESLLEEWQQRATRAEEAIAEIKRPLDEQMARLNETVTRLNVENERLLAQSATAPDTARLDFLAEITNLNALDECGAMLSGEQKRQLRKARLVLTKHEFHRRTHDTPTAFRMAVDEAMGNPTDSPAEKA